MASKFSKLFRGDTSTSHELLEDLDEVTCPICLEIYDKALKLSCGHIFCNRCLSNFDVPEPVCPLCRQTFDPSQTIKSENINKLINSRKGKCHGCSKMFVLSKLRRHAVSCVKIKDQVQSLSVPESDDKSNVNRHTFKCPFCGLKNFNTHGLIKHVNTNHITSTSNVVCPICASMPWGNPSQVSTNFVSHLNLRHKFEYDTYVDYEIDDQMALEQALRASLEEANTSTSSNPA